MHTIKLVLLAAGLLSAASLAGCGGSLPFLPPQTPTVFVTPGPSPTPAPVDFAQKDLSKVVLQASDLPRGYALVSELTKPTDLEQVFSDNIVVHSGVSAGYDVAYKQGDPNTGVLLAFDNAIFVYTDESQARQAYQSLSRNFAGPSLDFPALGSESIASHREAPTLGNPNAVTYTESVVWRQDTAVVLLDTFGSQAATQQMIKLAQTIQSRILQK